jgi:hypothetical protein
VNDLDKQQEVRKLERRANAWKWVLLVGVALTVWGYFGRNACRGTANSTGSGQSPTAVEGRGPKPVAGPKTTNFEIINWRVVRGEYGTVTVVGEVRNNGSIAAGVQLQAIMRADNGDVVGSDDFWPASISNIPPGGTWPISTYLSPQGKFSKVELRVIGVNVWD